MHISPTDFSHTSYYLYSFPWAGVSLSNDMCVTFRIKDQNAFLIMATQSKKNPSRTAWFWRWRHMIFEMLGTRCRRVRYHIQQDLNLQLRKCSLIKLPLRQMSVFHPQTNETQNTLTSGWKVVMCHMNVDILQLPSGWNKNTLICLTLNGPETTSHISSEEGQTQRAKS
jgi:hypothetical protein